MLMKGYDKISTTLWISALALNLSFLNSSSLNIALAQNVNSHINAVKKSYNASSNQTKNSKSGFNAPPTFHRRKTRLSAEEIKAAGEQANKFYREAEKKEKAGKLDEAKQLYYKAAEFRSNIWGQYDPAVANITIKIGQVELKQKHPKAARVWFKQTLKALSNRYGSGDYELVPTLTLLAKLEAGEKDHEAAASYYQHILLLQERKFSEEDPKTVPTRISYIEELIADKDAPEAEKVAGKAIEIEKKARGAASQGLPTFEQLLSSAKAARANNGSK